jgi:hypothetical protein
MNELIPQDHPDASPLTTPKNSKLRRRQPARGGFGGFGGPPVPGTVASFMDRGGNRVFTNPTTVDLWKTRDTVSTDPPETANSPENPPDPVTSQDSSFTVSSVGTVSHHQSTTYKTSTPIAFNTEQTKTNPPGPGPTGTTHLADGGGRTDTTAEPETGEKGKIRENDNSPPVARAPKNRLTDEEKAERAAAKKAQIAAERLEAKAAKIAELGGPLVTLPAVVLRDGTVMPVDAVTAARWLEGCLPELSVDVEHAGFPIGHPEYRLRLVQLGNEHSAVVLDPADQVQAEAVREALRAATVLHAHSAHADLVPLEHAGLCDATAWDKMTDTVILAKLTDPALCDSDEVGLKALAKAMLGEEYALSWKLDELRKEIFAVGGWLTETEFLTPVERSGWAQIPLCEAFVRYAASDVCDCSAIARVLS